MSAHHVLAAEEQFGRMRVAGDDFNDAGFNKAGSASALSTEGAGANVDADGDGPLGEPKAWQRLRYDHYAHTTPEERARFESELQFECCGHVLRLFQSKIKTQAGVGRTVWDASLVLAKFLEKRSATEPDFLRGKRVVEIGAGCGVSGIAAALLGAEVTFTDVARLIGHMRRNVLQNLSEAVEQNKYKVKILDWGVTPIAKFRPPVDFVLGADVIYSERSVKPMLRTAARLLGDGGGQFLLAFEVHVPEAVDKFWESVEEYFDIQEVPSLELDDRWQDEEIGMYICTRKACSTAAGDDRELGEQSSTEI